MKKVILGWIMLVSIAMMPLASNAQANTNQQIADEIIGIVKAQWAAEIADPSNVVEQFKNMADEYTEFNADYSTRLEGKALAMRLTEAGGNDPNRVVAAEMLNPKVQVYGDTAILTYNFAGVARNKEGETKTTRAKSTRVYAKQNGKWKLVHANFAPDPKPAN
jgi:ketosteroid isomerase-like protein